MATVYKAFDTRLEREVAIKVVRRKAFPEEKIERILKRFEREAKALAKLNHANIVPIIDSGEEDGTPYLVMGYIPGGTLKERLRGQPIPWQEAAQLLAPIARALAYSHKKGIIHRDIKPSNILITEENELMLTDFGIARVLQSEETVDLTGTGMGVGTPEYMAPEQGLGHKVDHRADIYALGIVLYEMVTGRKPFQADTPMAVIIKQINDPLPRPTLFIPELPKEVELILLKALAKNPDNRYQSMENFFTALEGLLDGKRKKTVRTSRPKKKKKKEKPEKKPAQRNWNSQKIIVSIALLGLTLIAVFAVPKMLSQPENTPVSTLTLTKETILEPSITATTTATTTTPTKTPTQTITPSIVPTLTSEPLLAEITDDSGIKMVLVHAGEFTMGRDLQVYLDSYYIDRYEVTNSLYRNCVWAEECSNPKNTNSYAVQDYYPNFSNHPVVNVTWDMAVAYCSWRGARLPSEAEWEKAARGTDGRQYPWGNEIGCIYANYYICKGSASAVGKYEAGISPYGVYDLAGNAAEWVQDWFADYGTSPISNPTGPESGKERVVRGGGYVGSQDVSSTRRNTSKPMDYSNITGFRCARDATPQE